MIRISVFTGLLPFVLLLQHPMCPMSVLLLLYIPLLQCRCSNVVCYWSTAHVFCACLFKKALPKVRLGHAFARLVSRSFVLLLWYCAITKHCGSYDDQLIGEVGKCTTKGTKKTVLASESLILRCMQPRWPMHCGSTRNRGLFWVVCFGEADTIDTYFDTSICHKHSTL